MCVCWSRKMVNILFFFVFHQLSRSGVYGPIVFSTVVNVHLLLLSFLNFYNLLSTSNRLYKRLNSGEQCLPTHWMMIIKKGLKYSHRTSASCLSYELLCQKIYLVDQNLRTSTPTKKIITFFLFNFFLTMIIDNH